MRKWSELYPGERIERVIAVICVPLIVLPWLIAVAYWVGVIDSLRVLLILSLPGILLCLVAPIMALVGCIAMWNDNPATRGRLGGSGPHE